MKETLIEGMDNRDENEQGADAAYHFEDLKATSTTQRSLAISAIRNNKVHLHTSAKSFIVEGTRGDKYAVTLHPNESCQCEALWNCWHIIVAKMSIGVDDDTDKKIYILSSYAEITGKNQTKKQEIKDQDRVMMTMKGH